jgi:hypothetical protein
MTKNEALTRRAVVDEYGKLAAELAPWKPKQSRLDELAKIIRDWYADADAETPHTLTGELYQATVTAKGMQTIIDMGAVWRALGRTKFIAAVSVTLKALEAVMPASTLATVTAKTRTGSRSLSVSPVPVPQAQEKAA